jgi:hypothetical protein
MQSQKTTDDEKLFLSRMLDYFDCAWDDYIAFAEEDVSNPQCCELDHAICANIKSRPWSSRLDDCSSDQVQD